MKIVDMYKNENTCVVSIVTALLCAAVTGISLVFPQQYDALAYAYPIQYPWQIVSGLFLHGSPQLSLAGSIGHLLFNLMLILPFGVLIEKLIGSRRFLTAFICFWAVNIITFYMMAVIVTPKGEVAHGAGISGVAFSYGVIGLYILIKLTMIAKRQVFKQGSFYLLTSIAIAMLIMINPYIAGIASMVIHLVAVISGAVFLMIQHQNIDTSLIEQQKQKLDPLC